jgi:toluene monooxygenase system protein E
MSEEHADTPARKKRRQRTFSAFGDVRKMPSEYEIVTHEQNWTLRKDRGSAFEQNPSSAPNLWFLTYRDRSPLQADNWDDFRDPDALTYKNYVTVQADAETKTQGVLDEYAETNADASLRENQVALLGSLFTPARYIVHGCQQIEAYIGHMAPSAYITNAAGFATADFLRRVSLIAYRTRELQLAHPNSGIGRDERRTWEQEPAWQPAREAIERALLAYDWGEAFTALNLVLAPTLDEVLIRQAREVSRDNGDELTWLLLSYLQEDNDRRNRWSTALARLCLEQRPGNEAVFRRWIDKWAAMADAAVAGLGGLIETGSGQRRAAGAVAAEAAEARERFHTGIFDTAASDVVHERTRAAQ